MKKSWIKGLDRIAILLAIPIAIYGFCLSYFTYLEKQNIRLKIEESLNEGYTEEEIYKFLKTTKKYREKVFAAEGQATSPKLIIDLLIKADSQEQERLPKKLFGYAVGACGAIKFALLTILSIGVTTRGVPRVVRWVREGVKTIK